MSSTPPSRLSLYLDLIRWSRPAGWLLLLHLGLVPTALAYILFLRGLRHVPAGVASIITLLESLTSALLAWLLFGEWLSPLSLLGAFLLIAAMLLLLRR